MKSRIQLAYDEVLKTLSEPSWQDRFYLRTHDVKFLAADLDGLANNPWASENALRDEVLGGLRSIRPNHCLALLAVVRDEALYLCEWIAHYRAIGVEWFFIYSNNNSDGTDRMLRWLSTWAPVTPIFDFAPLGINTQFKAYEHALTLLPEIRLFEWTLVVDGDEFLIPSSQHDYMLTKQLQNCPENTDSVLFPWLWRCWTPHFNYEKALLSDRFQYGATSDLMKSVSKLSNVVSLQEVHRPRLNEDGVYRDPKFTIIPFDELALSRKSITYEEGWVDHFWGKSFEEFTIKKSRGDTMNLRGGHWKREFEQYFKWNGSLHTENFKPQPRTLVDRKKAELSIIENKPGFEIICREIDKFYSSYFSEIRSNVEILRTFDQLGDAKIINEGNQNLKGHQE